MPPIIIRDDAIRFVSSSIKENLQSASEDDKEETKDADYDEWKQAFCQEGLL